MTNQQLLLILSVICYVTGHWIIGTILLVAALEQM